MAIVAGGFQVAARNLERYSSGSVSIVADHHLTDVARDIATVARLLQADSVFFRPPGPPEQFLSGRTR
jgi:hypothetical protein